MVKGIPIAAQLGFPILALAVSRNSPPNTHHSNSPKHTPSSYKSKQPGTIHRQPKPKKAEGVQPDSHGKIARGG